MTLISVLVLPVVVGMTRVLNGISIIIARVLSLYLAM